MKVCQAIETFPRSGKPIVLAIGSFDGIHLGHQAVIRSALGKAAELEGEAWIMTFSPHPKAVLAPAQAPVLLTSGEQQIEVLRSMKLDGVLKMPFTMELAGLSPEAFLDLLIDHIPQLAVIMVGSNFRFGHRAKGDVALLEALTDQRENLQIMISEEVCEQHQMISSTRIRNAITDGDLGLAESLLGRYYTVAGLVQDGKKRGRKIGFPTANVKSENGLLPPPGIYALRVRVNGELYAAAGYIAAEAPGVVEAHLLDFDGDLYGQEAHVSFVSRVRAHIDFSDETPLIDQIAEDVRVIRELLN